MSRKVLNFLLVITSLFGYLEWGESNSTFLFQAEMEVLTNLITDPISAIHPLTILPLFGQALLLFTVFQKEPSKVLTFTGLGGLSVLLLFMFIIGLITLDFKVLISTIPFIITAIYVIISHRREKRKS